MTSLSVEEAINAVKDHREEWMHLPASSKRDLLDECLAALELHKSEYVQAALKRRGYLLTGSEPPNNTTALAAATPAAKVETVLINMITGLLLGTWLSHLREVFDSVDSCGKFPLPSTISKNVDDSLRLQLGPTDYLSWVMGGFATIELHADTLANDEKSPEMKDIQVDASEYFSSHGGGIAAVLGAGNYDAPIDLLTALFIENNVVVYKFSPLAIELMEPFSNIFSCLTKRGYLSFATGASKEGMELINHADVCKWFMTGDVKTANNILWGSVDGSASKSFKSPLTEKEFTVELGNVSPYIIVPGSWTDTELYRHARHLVLGMLFNGGHVCAHPQVVITCKNWAQRSTFLKYVRESIEKAELVGMFYPNADKKFSDILGSLKSEGIVVEESLLKNGKAAFIENLPESSNFLREESFCPISCEVALDTDVSATEFLRKAVKLANDELKGTLCATVILKSATDEDSEALERAICGLKYGSVGVNVSALNTIMYPQLVWGGFPKEASAKNLQSGIGWFGNAYGIRSPLKSVMRSPFLGPNQYLQSIPNKSVDRLEKTFARCTSALCHRSSSQSHMSWMADWMKISSGLLFNF